MEEYPGKYNYFIEVDDLISTIVDYYGVTIVKNRESYAMLRPDYWDSRQREQSYSDSAYMALLKMVCNGKWDYLEQLTEALSQFYSDMIIGYNRACEQKGSSKNYFLMGMRMMEDLMDFIYATTGIIIE